MYPIIKSGNQTQNVDIPDGHLMGRSLDGTPFYSNSWKLGKRRTPFLEKANERLGIKYECVSGARVWLWNYYGLILADVTLAAQIFYLDHLFNEHGEKIPLRDIRNNSHQKPVANSIIIYAARTGNFTGHIGVITEIVEFERKKNDSCVASCTNKSSSAAKNSSETARETNSGQQKNPLAERLADGSSSSSDPTKDEKSTTTNMTNKEIRGEVRVACQNRYNHKWDSGKTYNASYSLTFDKLRNIWCIEDHEEPVLGCMIPDFSSPLTPKNAKEVLENHRKTVEENKKTFRVVDIIGPGEKVEPFRPLPQSLLADFPSYETQMLRAAWWNLFLEFNSPGNTAWFPKYFFHVAKRFMTVRDCMEKLVFKK